jgi:hypothetical protein
MMLGNPEAVVAKLFSALRQRCRFGQRRRNIASLCNGNKIKDG